MAQQGTAGRPKYLLIADGLREKIKAGTYPVDSKLPAVRELAAAHGTAQNTVRAAIAVLAREGLVESFQGDGIYVRRLPGAEASTADSQVGELADRVERVELNLAGLYSKLGYDYPRGDAAEGEDTSSTAVAHVKRA